MTVGFFGDWMKNYQTMLPDLLAAGIPVLSAFTGGIYVCDGVGVAAGQRQCMRRLWHPATVDEFKYAC